MRHHAKTSIYALPRHRFFFISFLLALLVLMNACTPGLSASGPPQASQIGLSGPALPNPGNPGVSRQQQIKVGLQTAQQVYQQMPVLPDSSPISQYVRTIGSRLAQQIPQQTSWPYQFHVLAESDINAFALPGGQVFVNLGAITAADNVAELAGVMAHEMSHVYLQHSAKMAVQQQQTQGLAALGAGILGAILGNGTAGAIANTGVGMLASLYSLKYSRQDEAQADATGAILMYKAGYNPRAMAVFFQKLESQGGASAPQFLSDHPSPGDRVAAVDREIAQWPPKRFINNSPNFIAVKQQAAHTQAFTAQQISTQAKSGYWARWNQQHGAAFNPNAQAAVYAAPQGAAAANPTGAATPAALANVRYSQVRPNRQMRNFQGGVFSLNYPSNWQAMADANQGGATIAPPAGAANGTVAYGVVAGSGGQNNASLAQTTQSLVQALEQSNTGMSVVSAAQPITVNGRQGESLMLSSHSPVESHGQALAEQDWLVTVAGSQSMLYLIFIAPQRDFSRLQPTYRAMLDSLQVQ